MINTVCFTIAPHVADSANYKLKQVILYLGLVSTLKDRRCNGKWRWVFFFY